MNYGSIRYIIGCILKVEALLMLLPMAAAVVYQETSGFAFLICAVLCLVIGTLLSLKKPKKTTYYAKEGYISVALGWIVMSIMGCLLLCFAARFPPLLTPCLRLFQVLRQQGPVFCRMWRLCQNVCCSGEAFLTGSAAWESSSLFWLFCLWPEVSTISS